MVGFRSVLYVERCPSGSLRGFACALRVACLQGARLTVAGVTPPSCGRDAASLLPGADLRREAVTGRWRTRLEDLAARGREVGVPVAGEVLDGPPAAAVVRAVARGGHDLVMKVAGTGRDRWTWRLDPFDRELLRGCPCPVWLLDPAQGDALVVVLAAVDVSRDDPSGLDAGVIRLARSLADRARADLRVVHAWSVAGESILASPLRGVSRRRLRGVNARTRRERRRRLQRLLDREAPGRSVDVALPKGRPVPAIRKEARRSEADVVVVGNAAHGGPEAWLFRNVPEGLVGRVPCSVLAVREPPPRPGGSGARRPGAREAALVGPGGRG